MREKRKRPMKLFKKKDVLLIGGALIMAVVLFVLFPAPKAAEVSGEVRIYVGEELYRQLTLGQPQTVTVKQENGRVNVIAVTENGVYMADSTCDNHDCIEQGEVTPGNLETRALRNWIICLPNQVTVELVTED